MEREGEEGGEGEIERVGRRKKEDDSKERNKTKGLEREKKKDSSKKI